MGEAARRRRAAQAPGAPAARPTAPGTDPRADASAALTRLVRLNPPGRVSLAGAYALGYGALGMAQHDGRAPDWFHALDPLDTLFLGTVFPDECDDEYGIARRAWLRLIRPTGHWRGIQRFVGEVVAASEEHQLPVTDGELMLLVAGRIEAAGLDQRKPLAALLPRTALREARCLSGPDPAAVLPPPPADAAAQVSRLWAPLPRSTCATTAPPPTRCARGCTCSPRPAWMSAPTLRSCWSPCTWHWSARSPRHWRMPRTAPRRGPSAWPRTPRWCRSSTSSCSPPTGAWTPTPPWATRTSCPPSPNPPPQRTGGSPPPPAAP